MKPIAIQLYSVRELCAADFPGTLKKIADIGYSGVELAGLNGLTPQEVRKLCDDLGMQVVSGHGGLPTADTVDQCVADSQVLGAKRLVTGFGPGDMDTLDKVKACAEKFQTGAELLKPSGLELAFHNHWWEFHKVEGRLVYDVLLEMAPDVQSELDVYWATYGGSDPVDVLAKHASRVPLLHIKDGPLTGGDSPDPHTAVGKGKVAMPRIVAAADPDTLDWLIVELDHCATDMLEAVADSYTYLVKESGLASGNR
jgi:sugar phosphate isomerase/epimerase